MNDREHDQSVFQAQKARQGKIILRTRRERLLFAVGLAGVIVLAFLLLF